MENHGQSRFCQHCGSPLNPGEKFCGNCGKAVMLEQTSGIEAQPIQNNNTYLEQPIQNVNPYTSQQPVQNTNQYASQQPVQNTNPYTSQQSVQNTNPYISQQPVQNTNPYTSQQPTAQNNFSQENNPYSSIGYDGMVTTQSDFTTPKKRSKKPFIIAGSAVVGVVAVGVASVMIFNALKPSGGPLTRIADSAKNLTKTTSATVSLDASYQGSGIKFDGTYELDKDKKEIVALFNGSAKSKTSNHLSVDVDDNSEPAEQSFKMIIYCKNGIMRAGASNSGDEMQYTEIKKEDLDKFFESLEQTEEPDWDKLTKNAKLSEYIYTDKIEEVSNALLDTFENGAGKEALGIKESSENGGTKYSFDVELYDTLKIAVDTVEPLFKDKTKFNEVQKQLPEMESTLNSIKLKFDVSVDKNNNLSGFNLDSFGFKFNLAITNIGNTKVQISDSEINELKNADINSSSYDKFIE